MKIYTKGGDKGTTSLIGGDRVKKNHPRINAYGTVDELIAWIGLIRDQDIDIKYRKLLIDIQTDLFTIEALLATPDKKNLENLPTVADSKVEKLESEIDAMNEQLPPISKFILPGGHTLVSYIHISRTVCRRTEREIINLSENEDVPEICLKYINRLSDYLFVFSRYISQQLDAPETPWIAK